MNEKFFYHRGKLLLSGEYLILDGAWGVALPTKKGQYLKVKKNLHKENLHWRALDEKKNLWFEAYFEIPSLEILSTNEINKALFLQKLLKATQNLSDDFLKTSKGLLIETELEFSPFWGLGSSSTLICNLALLAKIDPYKLLWKISPDVSGYDLACALKKQAILYKIENKIPKTQQINFCPPFKDQLFFLYLNQKQSSQTSIDLYKKKRAKPSQIEEISFISKKLIDCKNLDEFEKLMGLHEEILSSILKIPKIKEKFFPEYKGLIKSLGAWGGDFTLITYREGMREYFQKKGFHILIAFEEMILKK
jgi:mevalonate kinase